MKTQAVLSIKMDKSLKDAAKATAAKFGASLEAMITAMLREVVRTKTLPVSTAEQPSAKLLQSIKNADHDTKHGNFVDATTKEELDAILD